MALLLITSGLGRCHGRINSTFLLAFLVDQRQFNVDRRAKLLTSARATVIAPSHVTKVYHGCGVTPEGHIVIDHTRDLRPGLSNRHGKFPRTKEICESQLRFV